MPARRLPDGDVRDLFTDALKKAGLDGGVRLRLIIHDPELAQLPWEYTYLQRHRGERDPRHFLALDPRVSIVRHEPLPDPQPLLTGATPDHLRLIAATANVSAYPALDLARERRVIEEALAALDVDGVTLETTAFLEGVTRRALFDALQGGADLFHFAGHGEFRPRPPDETGTPRSTGSLVVASEHGSAIGETVDAGEAAIRLRQAGVRLAVLGACDSGRRDGVSAWTGIAPALLEAGVAAVVAMQYAVRDTHAIALSRTFYRAVAAGLSVDEALSLGRLAMLGEDPTAAQWGIPVLYTRAPDGMLFPRPPDRPSSTAAALRTVVRQTVKVIEAGGALTGIRDLSLGAGAEPVEVRQAVGTLRGEAVGIAGAVVAGTVDGHATARPAARASRRRRDPAVAARVDQDVGENLGSLSAIRDSVIHGDVRVELEVGAQVYLFTDRSRASVAGGELDRERSPFPGLRPFAFETRAFYCGRDALVAELERAVAGNPVVVVQGPSGSGRSSLLMAGFAPRAIERGLLVVRLDDYADLAGTLRSALASQSERLAINLGDDRSFAGILRAVTAGSGGTLILVLDQFERLFLLPRDAQTALMEQLAIALAAAGPLLRVVLSVREDAFGRLAELAAPVPGVLERSVRVNRLSRAEATAAIREPLLRHDTVAFDEAFVSRLVDDLDALSGPPPGEIEPGQLQIVCASLFERARALRDQGRSPVINAELYDDGAEAISVKYLEERLQSGLGDDREVGEAVLRSMLSSRDADWLSPAELQPDGGPSGGVDQVLRRLVTLGVLVERRVEEVEYSVATPAVESILVRLAGPSLIERRRASAVLETVGAEWRVRNAVARRGQLRLLAAAAPDLALTLSEAAILLRSAVAQHEPREAWRSQLARHAAEASALELDEARTTVGDELAGLLGEAGSDETAARGAGFGLLARAAVVAPTATDRETAVLVLSAVPDFELRLERALLLLPSAERRGRTIELWADLTDAGVVAPHVTERFGATDRLRIALARGRRRIRRDRREILGLSAGAGLGMGAGLGLVRFAEAIVTGVPPLGELLFWLMWGGLLGFVTAAAVLLAQRLRAVPLTSDGASFRTRAVAIAAGAVAFGAATVIVAIGNGLDIGRRPLMAVLGLAVGSMPAAVVAAGGFAGARTRAAAAIAGIGLWLAAAQGMLMVEGGRSASLPFLHSATFYSGALTRTFPALAAADPVLFTVLSIVDAFAIGLAIAIGLVVGLARARAIIGHWKRLEAMAGD